MNLDKFTDRAKGFLQSAQTVIVVADHQKFGRYAPVQVQSLERAHYLVTDREPDAEMAETLSPLAVEVLIAANQ